MRLVAAISLAGWIALAALLMGYHWPKSKPVEIAADDALFIPLDAQGLFSIEDASACTVIKREGHVGLLCRNKGTN